MATKKEKRARALAKREAFIAQYRADGLAALKTEIDHRNISQMEKTLKIQVIDHEHKEFVRKAQIALVMEKLKSGKDEVTVGEYLEASNELFPIFSAE